MRTVGWTIAGLAAAVTVVAVVVVRGARGSHPPPIAAVAPPVRVPAQPALPATSAVAAFVDARLPSSARMAAIASGGLVSVDSDAERAALEQVARSPGEPAAIRNEALNVLEASRHAGYADIVTDIAADQAGEPRMRFFALQHLTRRLQASTGFTDAGLERAMATVRRCAQADQPVLVRREAIAFLAQEDLLPDPTWVERTIRDRGRTGLEDLAIRIAARTAPHLRAEIRACIDHPDEVVAEAAIQVLGELGDGEASAAIAAAQAKSSSLRVRQAAEAALRRLGAAPAAAAPSRL